MELIFQEQRAQFDEQSSAEEMIEQVNTWLEGEYYFSHFTADGTDVFEDPFEYLSGDLSAVGTLEVQTKTKEEFVNDLLVTAEEYLANAKQAVGMLADGFAKGSEPELWANFADFLDGTDWIGQMVKAVNQTNVRPANWDECLKAAAGMEVVLNKMEPFVVNEQPKELAILLKENVIPLFEQLYKEVGQAVDEEGTRPDTN